MYKGFQEDIVRMNKMFELPVNPSIELDRNLCNRLYKFHKTLKDEVDEILDITKVLNTPYFTNNNYDDIDYPSVTIDHYVALADLLGDIIIYCTSEAAKHGIPLPGVLRAIMESQWTKLGANGEVLKDKNGKFLKGENYEPPEEVIKRILQARNRMVALSHKESLRDTDYE